MASNDDEFGNFEEATPSNNNQSNLSTAANSARDKSFESPLNTSSPNSSLPDWIIKSSPIGNNSSNSNKSHDSDQLYLKQLQDELSRTKELLIDQQTNYLQLQTQNQQQSNDFNSFATKMFGEFQNMLKQSLLKQREILLNDFKQLLIQNQAEQERKFQQQIKDSLARYETIYNENMEAKLAEYQELLIKHNESEYQDIEMKIKLLVSKMFKDEQEKEKNKLKQTVDSMEKEMKTNTEKYVKNYFMSQSEFLKDQIKSGILQEHLIHKDLINSKLEKLFKDSEEKRRQANLLFARHVSSLNFFVSNAQKQMSILKEAHVDLFKNKELLDYYGKTIPGNALSSGSAAAGPNADDIRREMDDQLIDQDFYLTSGSSNLELPIKSVSHLSLSAISTANQHEMKHQIPNINQANEPSGKQLKKPEENRLFDEHLFDEL